MCLSQQNRNIEVQYIERNALFICSISSLFHLYQQRGICIECWAGLYHFPVMTKGRYSIDTLIPCQQTDFRTLPTAVWQLARNLVEKTLSLLQPKLPATVRDCQLSTIVLNCEKGLWQRK